jgi:dienelactone hydrolase
MTGTEINALLEARLVDLAGRKPPTSIGEQQARARAEREWLSRALGLPPNPASSPFDGEIVGAIERDGYRIEKTVFYSRPGFLVTAHLYLPSGPGPFELILRPHGEWPEKMANPAVQAFAVSFALAGYAVMVVESPGFRPEVDPDGERAIQGNRDDPWLTMGVSPVSLYAWDLMRALDLLKLRTEIDSSKVGISGEDSGAAAAVVAFALDQRINCLACACFGASRKILSRRGLVIPGAAVLGDVSDLLALRSPSPVLLMAGRHDPASPVEAVSRTADKLRQIHKVHGQESAVRFAAFESGRDYNRRMRETARAFFCHHLRGEPSCEYRAETRPITDGSENRYRAETLEPADERLAVLPPERRLSRTMSELFEPPSGQAPYDPAARLVPWAKYGRLPTLAGPKLKIKDADWPLDAIDLRMSALLGVSVPEMIAQILHLSAPGGQAHWETSALGPSADIMTSLIGSVKTLVRSSSPEIPVSGVEADGPVSSMAALFFKGIRPDVEISVSHQWQSWGSLYRAGPPALVQPACAALGWPMRCEDRPVQAG